MNELFEVTRDEYVGFVDQISASARRVEQNTNDSFNVLEIFSQNTGNLLCARWIPIEEGTEHFYIYQMPEDDERCAPPIKRKIVLEDQDEVQAFFNILSDLKKAKEEA